MMKYELIKIINDNVSDDIYIKFVSQKQADKIADKILKEYSVIKKVKYPKLVPCSNCGNKRIDTYKIRGNWYCMCIKCNTSSFSDKKKYVAMENWNKENK